LLSRFTVAAILQAFCIVVEERFLELFEGGLPVIRQFSCPGFRASHSGQRLRQPSFLCSLLLLRLHPSERTQPYLDCLIKAYRNNTVGLEASLEVIRDLPLGKRYTWRVFSALKWAFADFDDEYVALDLPHIPEPRRSEMTKELERRLLQLRMLLETFHTE
jgi:hypothetical protein